MSDLTMRPPAYLLAGGRSRRLGRDKARALLDDTTTVLEAVAASIEDGVSSMTVVADEAKKYDDLGIRTIADFTPHQGPLAGILRAAVDAGEGYFFVCSCDRVGLDAAWIDRLIDEIADEPQAVCFCFDGRLQPLFGLYRADLADDLRRAIDGDRRAVWRFLDAIDARQVQAPEGWRQTVSVNTPEQLKRARRQVK